MKFANDNIAQAKKWIEPNILEEKSIRLISEFIFVHCFEMFFNLFLLKYVTFKFWQFFEDSL